MLRCTGGCGGENGEHGERGERAPKVFRSPTLSSFDVGLRGSDMPHMSQYHYALISRMFHMDQIPKLRNEGVEHWTARIPSRSVRRMFSVRQKRRSCRPQPHPIKTEIYHMFQMFYKLCFSKACSHSEAKCSRKLSQNRNGNRSGDISALPLFLLGE